jgi:hypothetical protein
MSASAICLVLLASVAAAAPEAGASRDFSLPDDDDEVLPLAEPPDDGPLVLGGEAIAPGHKREVLLRLSESFTATQVDIPVVVVRGTRPGASLCLVAGVHGDELNGMEIVRTVMDSLTPQGLTGTVIGVPIVNVFGFANQTRHLPDRRDLNRHFPGSPTGSTAARIAHRLSTEVLRHCTHLVDFHTGSLNRTNVAQIRGDLRSPQVLSLARAFGAPALVHSPGGKGTLRRTAVQAGIAAVLYEAGETLRFQQPEIRRGVVGVRSVLAALGIKPGAQLPADESVLYVGTSWLRAERGGLLVLDVRPGDSVRAGDLLGTITDPLRHERGYVRAHRTGRILGAVLAPMVLPGLAVVNIGLEGTLERLLAKTPAPPAPGAGGD